MTEDLLTATEAATVAGVSRRTIERAIAENRLPAGFDTEGKRCVARDALTQWVSQRGKEKAAAVTGRKRATDARRVAELTAELEHVASQVAQAQEAEREKTAALEAARERIRELTEDRGRLWGQVERLTEAVSRLALPAHEEPGPVSEPPAAPRAEKRLSWWQRLWRGDALE